MVVPSIQVIGAGPAGTTAALAARREGSAVTLYEKSHFPRHKVCGEFLSPEVAQIFDRLGILEKFLDQKPHRVSEAAIHIGKKSKSWKLSEPAFGISRFALDRFLLGEACASGAQLVKEAVQPGAGPLVIASGRKSTAPAGTRIFGFKAHFSGPVTDRIDLLFDRDFYIGISSIENGLTNVCGLAAEPLLRSFGFEPDGLLAATPHLAERLKPLTRSMEWLITGPLVYGGRFRAGTPRDLYLAGDALGFVDPFTGSGMLGAFATGFLAGQACALGTPSARHVANCRRVLGRQYFASTLFRKLIGWGVAERFSWLPGQWMFDVTRPAVETALALQTN